jgi:ribokinase
VGCLISIGSVNADFQMRVSAALSGTELARDFVRASGGKAANVAVLGRRLGMGARLVGCVGQDDLAQQALAGPRAIGVDLSGVRSASTHTGTSIILVRPDGDKTIVLALGANDAWSEHAGEVAETVSDAEPDSIVVVDLEVAVEVADAAIASARRTGLEVVLDPAPADRATPERLARIDHLTPNHREAEELSGIAVDSPDAALQAARALRDRGVANAYVKLAAGGCAVASAQGETALIRSPDDLNVVDTTGAGDAFAGALAWALLEGWPPTEAAVAAVAASSCATTAYGSQASYPSIEALMAMAERVRRANLGGRRRPPVSSAPRRPIE